jgi:hypothetical protein
MQILNYLLAFMPLASYAFVPALVFKVSVVNEHNIARAQYGARNLTWTEPLYAAVTQWAQRCKFMHSVCFSVDDCEHELILSKQSNRQANTARICTPLPYIAEAFTPPFKPG